ncbi:iron complex outermembrane receptor protein [Tenacibaculum lutimaris]|uniref:Iron complex outermembrane receptor protein n=1 Tax=Tenacibaculum lutimaris TaxID=285258 RepID=A0A420E1E7_9FLAO|nr:TonB-dependent receptor [Tenacibaculum lutimaris]RKF03707.1 iron complex outermembrane receptor protein [Tenacibaculum lutimaris]
MKTIINFLFFIGISAVYAQNSLSGKITDTNNQPLLGVEIYSDQLHKGTITNEDGTYNLQNIPNGKVTFNFSFLGFKTIAKEFIFNNKNISFDVQLEESVFKIDEVIISTPFNKLQSENVMKVERLSARAIQKTGATTLSEGITNIAGVSQVSTGTSIGKPVIRGLSGNRVLVYTQGIRLENQQFGGEHGLGINDAGVAGVEVIKGPASLLYGSDALGGVLYIQPEKFVPENTTKLNVSQRYFSNTLGTNTSLGFKSSLKNWQFLARGTYAQHADYKTPDYRVTNTRFNEKDLKLGIGFHEKNFSSELRYNFNNSKLGLTEGIGEQTKETHLETPYQDIDNHIISLHNHVFFKNSKLDIDLGYTINNRQEFEEHHDHAEGETEEEHEEHEEAEAALDMKLKTFSYNTKYHLPKFGKFEVLLGVQGLHQTNTNFGEELLIPNATVNDFGVFTTANFEWNDNTSLQAGIRYDNRGITTERHEVAHEDEIHVFEAIDKSYNSFTASFGAKTMLFNTITSRFNVASGFRAPNLAELTSNGVHHGTNRFEVGNNNLVNEKNLQFDLSLDYNSEHFELFANGFYNKLNDYIYLSPTGEVEDSAPVYTYLQENAKLYGGEFGFHLHPHPLDWLHLESSFEMVIGKQDNGNYLPLIPANTLKNTLRTEFSNEKWLPNGYASVSLHSYFKQDNISEFETATPAYNLVNLGVGGDILISKYTFTTSLTVNNLFDKKYINHLSRLKPDNIFNPGRNIVLGINFTI